MPEYINREELIKALEADYNSDWDRLPDTGDYVEGVRDEYDDVLTIICRMKGTDAQSVRRGRWDGTKSFIICSVCHKEAYWDTDYGQQLFDYCPYCGAKMDLKEG